MSLVNKKMPFFVTLEALFHNLYSCYNQLKGAFRPYFKKSCSALTLRPSCWMAIMASTAALAPETVVK